MMKKLLFCIALSVSLMAQAQTSEKDYLQRYLALAEKVGADGLGIETLIEKWQAAFPDDREMLNAKAVYYLLKSQSRTIVQKNQSRYLGEKPIMSLKDSLGGAHNYFKDIEYDDAYFSIANKTLDDAISKYPLDLQLRSDKISAMLAYEKEHPDMALQIIRGLVDFNYSAKPKWTYGRMTDEAPTFEDVIQDACFRLYTIGSPASMEAFKTVSEKVLSYSPKALDFITNLGTYYLVYAKDPKNALKYYGKVLKIDSKNYTAVKNCVLAARNLKDTKSEKKYLLQLAAITSDEVEKEASLKRAESLK